MATTKKIPASASMALIREDVEEALEDLLPYVLSARYLKSQVFYRVYILHRYTRDVLAILVGLGLGFPGAKIFGSGGHENLGKNLYALPWFEWLPILIAIVIVAIFRVYVASESVERRAHLVQECETELDVKYLEIDQALRQRNPLKNLTSIRNSVANTIFHHTRLRSYTFQNGRAPKAELAAQVQAKNLCDANEHRW